MKLTNITQKLLFISLFALLLSSSIMSCSNTNENPRFVLPDELRELVNTNRRIALPPPADNLVEMLNSFQTPNLTAEADNATAQRVIQSRQRRGERPATLTHEQIISELDFLFNVLRYGYGAYQYFGGDDVFLPLKQSMIAQLSQKEQPVNIDDYITNLLVPSLRSVIADNHFRIDHFSIGVRSQFYMNEDYILREIENGFITEIDGQTYQFSGATLNQQTVKGILPTLTKKGEFAWAFGYVAYNLPPTNTADPTLDLTVSLKNTETNAVSCRTIQLYSQPNASGLSTDTYFITEKEGITVLSNRRLWGQDQSVLQSFAETGRELRNEPILILDLRGHEGGNDGFAARWIQQYTRGSIGSNVLRFIRHFTRGSSVFAGNVLRSATVGELSQWLAPVSPPQWRVRRPGILSVIQNENLVIVLTDNAIMSTGDAFVGMLRQLENVLFVGANTSGTLVTGNIVGVPLPYSRANVAFGIHLNILPDLSPFEGVGFAPDLWVAPDASLERVLLFVNSLGNDTLLIPNEAK